MKKSEFISKLSQPVALSLAVCIGLLLMAIQYATWLKWETLGQVPSELVLATDGSFNIHLLVGVLLSILSALFVYLSLINRMQTQTLKNKTSQMQTLFENMPGTAYRLLINTNANKEEAVEFLSEGCLALTGYTPEHFTKGKMAFLALIDNRDVNKVIDLVNSAVKNKNMYDFECRIHTKNGDLKWLWHRGRAAADDESLSKARIEGFVIDITARKQAEIDLIQARAYSEAIVDTAVEAVITIDSKGIIKSFNRSAEHIFGYTLSEVKGQSVNILMPLPFRQDHDSYINGYIDTKEAKVIGTGRELKAIKKDGRTFPIELSISEVHHQQSRTFVGLIRDVSQQRAAENEARLHRDQLAHVDRLNVLGEMASGIAHEINQPLAAISLFSQAGKRFLNLGQYNRVPEVFDKLSQHAQRAGAIIERIQSMAKQHASEKKRTDCYSLIFNVAELAEAEARIHDIEIDVNIASDLPDVSVDVVQIQQVVLNLLRNGMQAMREIDCINGKKIELKASLNDETDTQKEVRIAVIDSGKGVSEEAEKKLFEPFSTTKESGMGMGLSISNAIIEAHNGHINFYNNIDCGATFYFTLLTNKRDS